MPCDSDSIYFLSRRSQSRAFDSALQLSLSLFFSTYFIQCLHLSNIVGKTIPERIDNESTSNFTRVGIFLFC